MLMRNANLYVTPRLIASFHSASSEQLRERPRSAHHQGLTMSCMCCFQSLAINNKGGTATVQQQIGD